MPALPGERQSQELVQAGQLSGCHCDRHGGLLCELRIPILIICLQQAPTLPHPHREQYRLIKSTYIALRRAVVLIVGVSIVIVGAIMIVTPGPAIIVIPAGLALLATEFIWARRLLERMKDTITKHTTNGKKDKQADNSEKQA